MPRCPSCSGTFLDRGYGRHVKECGGSHGLTRRELEIVELIVSGMSGPQICKELGLSYDSYRSHMRHICDKTGFDGQVGVAVWYVRNVEQLSGV